MVGNEGVAVIALRRAVVLLHADAVRGDHRHGIRHGMALHRALPARMRVEGEVVGLGADGRRVEQNLGALQHHGARGLRVPLIPADADADHAGLRLPRLEAGVAGAEVIFLLIARTVGDVALAVDAENLAVSVGNRHAVVVTRAVLLEEGDGNDELQFLGELLERTHATDARSQALPSRTISGPAASGSRCSGTAQAAARLGRRAWQPRGRSLRSWRCWPPCPDRRTTGWRRRRSCGSPSTRAPAA